MKKSNKKIPAVKLPKYSGGGGGYNEFGFNYSDPSTDKPASGNATSNYYEDKRKKQTKGLTTDQYMQIGNTLMNMGTQYAANNNLTEQDKTQANYQATNSAINSIAGSMTPWYTYAKAASDMGRGMVARDESGKPVDATNAQMDAVMKPQHEMITEDLTKGNTGLAIGELLLPGLGYESRSNALGLGKDINRIFGVKNTEYMYKMGGNMKYAMGGMEPNAEVEGNEMITSNTPPQTFGAGGIELASNNPYSAPTYKTNGATHEDGGIPVNMQPGSIINGKTKVPAFMANKKGETFAEYMKKLANEENSVVKLKDNILKKAEKGDKYSKNSSDLLSLVLDKKLQGFAELKNKANNIQNAIIANKEQLKAIRKGELPSMDNEQMEPQGISEASEGEYKKGGIYIKPSKRGTFTAAATKHGKSVQGFASQVLANKENYSPAMVKKANFARNAAKWKHEMGGVQLPYYNTDSNGNPIYAMGGDYPAMTNPYHNFKGSKPVYEDGGPILTKPEYEQAQTDSMTLYKAGLASKNLPSYQYPGAVEAAGRLTALNKQTPTTTKGEFYGNVPGYTGGYNVAFTKPTMVSYNKSSFTPTEKFTVNPTPVNKVQQTVSTDKGFKYINNPSYGTYAEQWNKQFPQSPMPVYKYGGNLPKYDIGGEFINGVFVPYQSSYKPGTIGYNDSMNSPENPSNDSLQSSYRPDVLPWNRTNDSGQGPNGNAEKSNFEPPAQQFQEVTKTKGIPNTTKNDDTQNKINWKNIGMQALNFGAQNAGSLYDLLDRQKVEEEKYGRITPNTLNDAAAIREAQTQGVRAAKGLANAAGGSGAAYLAARGALASQTAQDIDKVRQNYANLNAGILNEMAARNKAIEMQEIIANMQNRAQARNLKRKAIGDIGTNVASQMADTSKTGMDQKTLQLYMQYYNNPEFRAAMKKAGYDIG